MKPQTDISIDSYLVMRVLSIGGKKEFDLSLKKILSDYMKQSVSLEFNKQVAQLDKAELTKEKEIWQSIAIVGYLGVVALIAYIAFL